MNDENRRGQHEKEKKMTMVVQRETSYGSVTIFTLMIALLVAAVILLIALAISRPVCVSSSKNNINTGAAAGGGSVSTLASCAGIETSASTLASGKSNMIDYQHDRPLTVWVFLASDGRGGAGRNKHYCVNFVRQILPF